jgi:hypothetical protein
MYWDGLSLPGRRPIPPGFYKQFKHRTDSARAARKAWRTGAGGSFRHPSPQAELDALSRNAVLFGAAANLAGATAASRPANTAWGGRPVALGAPRLRSESHWQAGHRLRRKLGLV